MKKFGPYKGVTNHQKTRTNNPQPLNNEAINHKQANKAVETDKKDIITSDNSSNTSNEPQIYRHKPTIDQVKRKYESYLIRHRHLSESLEFPSEDD